MNVYDFDKTIYNGDSSIDFYLFCLKRNKSIIFLLPKQILYFILYKLKIKTKVEFKECFFSFLKKIKNVDNEVELFWNKNIKKIKEWYLEQKLDSDVIISASPEFLLAPLEKVLSFKVIATKVNQNNGKFLSKNCYGEEKTIRFKERFPKSHIKQFYTDSLSDLPMLKMSDEGFLVKKNKLVKYCNK